MNRWKLFVPVVAGVASLFAAGCATREVVVREGPPPSAGATVSVEAEPSEVVVNTAPPAEQVEVVPAAPVGDYVYIKGHWHWNGGTWVWNRGHYEVRRSGWRWVPAHYAQRGPNWIYVSGHWGR